jgi:hypothetical protein
MELYLSDGIVDHLATGFTIQILDLSIKFCFKYSNWFCCTWSYFSGNFALDHDLRTDPVILMPCPYGLIIP